MTTKKVEGARKKMKQVKLVKALDAKAEEKAVEAWEKEVTEDKVKCLIIRKADEDNGWGVVCMTEFMTNGRWVSGLILIDSIEAVLDRAEKEGLSVGFEKHMREALKLVGG